MKRFLQALVAIAMATVLTACYQLDVDIRIDADDKASGEVIVSFPAGVDMTLEDLEVFEQGYEPDNLEREIFSNDTSQGVVFTFTDHDIEDAIVLQGPYDDVRFLSLSRFNHTYFIRGTSLTEDFCGQEEFEGMQQAWDVEVVISYEAGEADPILAYGNRFQSETSDGGVIVWRPQFGTTDDMLAGVYYPTAEHPVGGFGGPEDLREFSGCGQEADYADLVAAYEPSTPEDTEPEASEETKEEPVAGASPTEDGDAAAAPVAVDETDGPDAQPVAGDGLLYGIIGALGASLVAAIVALAVGTRSRKMKG